jgi:hypothetical protein
MPAVSTLSAGDAAASNPFRIAFVGNPAIEAPWNSGRVIPDPILQQQTVYDAAVQRALDALFGRLAGQRETHLAASGLAGRIRMTSIFDPLATATLATALVAEHATSNLLIPRRTAALPFLARYGETADVVFSVSLSAEHDRCSSYYTTDDDSRAGVAFQLDGQPFSHRYYCVIPGTVALHATAYSLTPLHEFQHAVSSYTNGAITDLYVDSQAALNCKVGRPIPLGFASYGGNGYSSDTMRDGLAYPPSWQSYHCELCDKSEPAVMDDYWQASAPELPQNDTITRQFIQDRIAAKMARP